MHSTGVSTSHIHRSLFLTGGGHQEGKIVDRWLLLWVWGGVCVQVLKGVSIRIMPGESVAVVGSSGSGKSTILKLVTRLYDAVGGKVLVNGVDVKDLQTASIR
jgi:ABC-type multidrug transport system ATPase subunit